MKTRVAVLVLSLLASHAAAAKVRVALGKVQYRTNYSFYDQKISYANVVIVDMKGSVFAPVVSPRDISCPSPRVLSGQVYTADFARDENAFMAITGNTGAANQPQPCVLPFGLMVSRGKFVNWPQDNGPVLYFTPAAGGKIEATITDGVLPPLSEILAAVAGTTSPDCNCTTQGFFGTLLVKNGEPGKCAVPKPTTIAPRGAIGLNQAGDRLIVVVVQGNEEGRPPTGLFTSDLALLLIAFGAWNAINLDGGGNANFVWNPKPELEFCESCWQTIAHPKIPTNNPNQLSLVPEQLDITKHIDIANVPGRYNIANMGFRASVD